MKKYFGNTLILSRFKTYKESESPQAVVQATEQNSIEPENVPVEKIESDKNAVIREIRKIADEKLTKVVMKSVYRPTRYLIS